MIKRLIVFFAWTGFAIWLGKLIWVDMYGPMTTGGTDFRVTYGTTFHLQINSDEVTVTGASCAPFILWRQDTNETMVGEKTDAPLGVDCSSYYVYGPKSVKGGNWIIQVGSPELRFQSPHPITITSVWNTGEAALQQLVLTLCLLVFWGLIGFGWILDMRI